VLGGRYHFEYLDVDGWIIKIDFKEILCGRVGLLCLKMRTGSMLLWTRKWISELQNFGKHLEYETEP
jgi:hypothetical protein